MDDALAECLLPDGKICICRIVFRTEFLPLQKEVRQEVVQVIVQHDV